MTNYQHKVDLLVREWEQRPTSKRRSETDILSFMNDIRKSNPALLNLASSGDTYQLLKTLLSFDNTNQ